MADELTPVRNCKRTIAKQADPGEGWVVGAFCRTYGIQAAIDTLLPTIYKPSVMEGRYDYIPADSSAGVVLYDDKFAYSHRATIRQMGYRTHLISAFIALKPG